MKFALLLLLVLLAAQVVRAGNIVGTVKAQGKAETESDGDEGNYASHKFKFAERVNYDELKDFVVYIEGTISGAKPPSEVKQIVTQKDATFSPHVLPIMVGTKVRWPNKDNIYHNVFSSSPPKKFDLGLYSSKDAQNFKELLFDKTGQIDVFCSIHAKMHCIILVLDNPYFASSDGKNHYVIANVPAGHYKLTAWHERLPELTQEIDVPETGSVKMDFIMGIKNLPKY